MIVLDASALLEMLLGTKAGRTIAASVLVPGQSLHAPHLVDVEVMHALRRYVAMREIGAEEAAAALADLAELPLNRYGHTVLLDRAWELRRSVTPDDAMYIALAEALSAPLLTRDAKLARSHGHAASIRVV